VKIRYARVPIDSIVGFARRNSQAVEGYEIGPFKWRARINMNKQNKPVFRKALRESIAKEGMRNPLLGWHFKEGLFIGFGAGRLKAATEAGLTEVPMIINDFVGEWEDAEEVTKENWTKFFTDIPLTYEFDKTGFTYHYNLTPSTRTIHDPGGTAWYDGDVSDFYGEFPYLEEFDEIT
jgi:hypothetical protein